jgi:Tfp pilus assembly protein FimT
MRVLSSTRRPGRRRARSGVRPGSLRRRAGVTIVELMVAIILLAIGLLGMAGVSVVVMTQVTSAANHTVAASVLQSRFEPLERRSCGVVLPGTDTYRGVEETWTTSTVAARARGVRDSVRFAGFRGRKSIAVSTVVSCEQ